MLGSCGAYGDIAAGGAWCIGLSVTGLLFEMRVRISPAEAFDNSIMALIFLDSLFFATPFILVFINKEELEKIPGEIRESPYFMKAWKNLTFLWGAVMLISGGVVVIVNALQFRHALLIDYLTGWPLILILFLISYGYPMVYWSKTVMSKNKEP